MNLLNKATITGAKKASDPVFNMVAQLVAVRLNLQAGAGTCGNFVNIVNNAQTFLFNHNFDGSSYTPNKLTAAQTNYLNTLATLLDGYNNTSACPAIVPTPVP